MLALLAGAACADIGLPDGSVTTADLVVLALQGAAPAPPVTTFMVPNDRATVRTIRHPDAFITLDLELRFPAGGLYSLDGTTIGPTDSIEISVEPLAGGYGFTLSPPGLTFAAAPTALLSFGRYADPSDGSAAFGDTDTYLAALQLWVEGTPDRWTAARNSGPAGVDEVRAFVDAPGIFRLAAARE
jgi:hypothetical protein